MEDFTFGTLATDELRLAHVRALRSGITHNISRTPRDPLPDQPITIRMTIGPDHPCDRAWVYWTDDIARRGHATPMEPCGTEWDTMLWGYIRHFQVTLPGQPAGTVLRYRIGAATPDGSMVFADDGAFYACYIADDPPPAWAQDAVIYHIFVDRFFPGKDRPWQKPERLTGFFGGRLRGIIEKLDYISGLGANTLWFSPIFPSPSHHGYDATDYFDIEPRLGKQADLRELLDSAHALGIHVLLDFVPNHWSHLHPTFQQAISDPKSRYRQWYNFRRWPDEYETFFGVRSLPQVNLRHPPARQHMLDAAAHWLEFGVDGYRLDYASGPAPDFWADFRRVCRTVRPDAWTFGEVVDPPDSQLAFEGGLDGCLDFILLEAVRQTFAFARWDAARFAAFLDRHEAHFPATFSRPSFLDNHDMNRFLWAAEGDKRRLKLAALCQFTLAGPPIIYYGTEAGLSQVRDVRQGTRGLPEEARLPMLWDSEQNTDLLDFYCSLIALRRRESSLRRGTRRTFHIDADTLAYLRENGGDTVAVAINLSSEPRTATLDGIWNSLALATDPACAIHPQAAGTRIELPPLAGMALKP